MGLSKRKSTTKKPKAESRKRSPQPIGQKPESEPPPSISGPEQQATQEGVITKGTSIPGIQGSDPKEKDFAPVVLEKTVIAMPLFKNSKKKRKKRKEEGPKGSRS